MKVCDSWLSTWTRPSLNHQQKIEKFTMAGLEIEETHAAAPDFSEVVVAEVMSTMAHPQADKLTVCQINNGEAVVQVVCGASNVRTGLKVALAKPGAKLPGGLKIAEAKLRGEMSFGMLCSPAELGCAESSEGIWELPKDAPIGQNLREYLQLDEKIYAFELTPNRGDCFSALGLARELAAITKSHFTPLQVPDIEPMHDEVLDVQVRVDWAPCYMGRKINNIRPHTPTPLWLKEHLRRIGLRSVHPVVDVLNYVMYFLGQPMHAFDCHKIGALIEVTEAQESTTMTLLNGKMVELKAGTPLITNGQRPIAIAGVMGSQDSAVDEDSSEIFLESAFFAPIKLAGVARTYGLSSDAAVRYERGVDPDLAATALEFATQMLLSIVGGQPGPIIAHKDEAHLPKRQEICFAPSLFRKRSGVALDEASMLEILTALHFKVTAHGEVWQVEVPSFRFDITQDVDLVEEILRVYGYENIPTTPLEGRLQTGRVSPLEALQDEMLTVMQHLGYQQAINYAFVDPKIQGQLFPSMVGIDLLNPISPDCAQMRLSLWPGLITSLLRNVSRQQNALQLMEAGVVFHGSAEASQESIHFSGLLYGAPQSLNWCSDRQNFDFYAAKGQITHLLQTLGYDNLRFVASAQDALHPGQTASIEVNGVSCGYLGCLHPKFQLQWELSNPVVLWDLDLTKLPSVPPKVYRGLSKYPATRRDLSFLIQKDVLAQDILDTVKSAVHHDKLKDLQLFDVYQGPNVAAGMVSIALSCLFQDQDKTLTEEDILSMQNAILEKLQKKFDVKIRDGQ